MWIAAWASWLPAGSRLTIRIWTANAPIATGMKRRCTFAQRAEPAAEERDAREREKQGDADQHTRFIGAPARA